MDLHPSHSGRFIHTGSSTPTPRSSNVAGKTNCSILKSMSDASSGNRTSIPNSPRQENTGINSSDASWVGWWSSSTTVYPPEFAPLPSQMAASDVNRSDFRQYLGHVVEMLIRFEDIRNHACVENLGVQNIGGHGEALIACLREVPALYFSDNFSLEDGATFQCVCLSAEDQSLQGTLSQYLDVIEVHLVKEIALRSNSFFEAQGELNELNLKIDEGCNRIRDLKETIRLVDIDLVQPSSQIQDLNTTKRNLLALQGKLRLILYANQASSTLKLLVATGDCTGALDVISDLKHLLDGGELSGLHCFRHLREHVTQSLDSVNRILLADFLHVSFDVSGKLGAAALYDTMTKISPSTDVFSVDIVMQDEHGSGIHDRLVPIIFCLLRTAQLPFVLKMYGDRLTTDIKTSIKTAVAELLPLLFSRLNDSDVVTMERVIEPDGGGSSLAAKLRSLPPDNFVLLLATLFSIIKAHLVRAAKVKKSVESIVSSLDGEYTMNGVPATSARAKVPFQESSNDGTIHMNFSRSFRADVLRENTEAVFSSCDAAHGRWAKLLGARAIHHQKLRLQDFLGVYTITQEFINFTEKIGGRLGYSIRGTLQSQAKAFVDFQHESRMTKLKAVLDQETWAEVDVPDEFQAILASTFSNGEAAVLSRGDYDHTKISDPEKQTTKSLFYKGEEFHVINCCLILVKMISEYVDMNSFLPALSSELVGRVVDILKLFNMRTYQLVLGAGAIQVAGLKSITAKHLALASQLISLVYSIIFDVGHSLLLKVPEARKALLLSEIERVAQDYKNHQVAIHGKLVQMMRDRLMHHLRGLPQIVEGWNKAENHSAHQPTLFARALTKEVSYVHRVLSRTLHGGDVMEIFTQVAVIFDSQIADALGGLQLATQMANYGMCRDVKHITDCLGSLPYDNSMNGSTSNTPRLDDLCLKKQGPPS